MMNKDNHSLTWEEQVFQAIEKGEEKNYIRTLLLKGDLNVRNQENYTPILYACKLRQQDIVELLIELGADINMRDSKSKTVLYYASKAGWLPVVQSLVDKGIDVNVPDKFGITPLHQTSYEAIAEVLVKAGADCNALAQNNPEFSPFLKFLHIATDLKLIQLCIENGAYFNPCDYSIVLNSQLLRNGILQDVKLCSQAIVNKYNNKTLPTLYHLLSKIKRRLPNIERLKITSCSKVFKDIEHSVKFYIQTKGHCSLATKCPLVLSMLCTQSIIDYCSNNLPRKNIAPSYCRKYVINIMYW